MYFAQGRQISNYLKLVSLFFLSRFLDVLSITFFAPQVLRSYLIGDVELFLDFRKCHTFLICFLSLVSTRIIHLNFNSKIFLHSFEHTNENGIETKIYIFHKKQLCNEILKPQTQYANFKASRYVVFNKTISLNCLITHF